VFCGRHPKFPIMQILELPMPDSDAGRDAVANGRPTHPFFLAAQFHPELTGGPLRPQPMFSGLVAAAVRRKYPDAETPAWTRGQEAAEVKAES